MLPAEFIARMRGLLPAPEAEALFAALTQLPVVALRANRCKPARLPDQWSTSPVPWYPAAVLLTERPVFTREPAFHAGGWYVQEAASMAVARFLPPTETPLVVLDLCAAPGGKATLLLDAAPAGSVVVANEAIRSRVGSLCETATRWGNAQLIVTHNDPADFAPLAGSFDAVFVDAPCSGEGLWRRRPQGIAEFSPAQIAHCAARQNRILAAALPLVRPGGVLVYSTCTWAEAENEAQIAHLAEQHGSRLAPIACPELTTWGWLETEAAGFPCYRAYPHRVAGEGLFVAALRVLDQPTAKPTTIARRPPQSKTKPPPALAALRDCDGTLIEIGDMWTWQPPGVTDWLAAWAGTLRVEQAGIGLGCCKGRDFVPDHAWALACNLPRPFPMVEVDRETALLFLKKEPIDLGNSREKGYYCVTYEGLGLGWVKHIGSRSNNLLPKSWRILRDLDAWDSD